MIDEDHYLKGEFSPDCYLEDFELNADELENQEEEDGEEFLEGQESTLYRAIAARLNYLAPDRMDIQFAAKEAARAMSAPQRKHWRMLHKVGRYLLGAPRMLIKFPWQVEQSMVTTFTDSDWAGCVKTARSTSGGIVAVGDHVLKTYSRQQKVVALSSAEAELYAMVTASAETLAMIAYARDLGHELDGEVFTDSAAALGISQRAGIGKVRHLRTQGLWVQEVRVSGRLQYRKVLGTLNPSDVLTKHVAGDLLAKHVEAMGMERSGGRAETAPDLNSLEVVMVQWTGVLQEAEGDGGHRAQVQFKDKRVRFSPVVQFRAVPQCNRGRRCKGASKERAPGGVGHQDGAHADRPGVAEAGDSMHRSATAPRAEGPAKTGLAVYSATVAARPRWADLVDDQDISSVSVFHGSEAVTTMVSELSGSREAGTPLALWQAIDGSTGAKWLTTPNSRSWRPHTE